VSSKLSVGIHILTVLALYPEEPLTSEQLACSVNTNPVVIRRLLGLLREAGYVGSKTGVGGGWSLVVESERITFLDVLRTVEPQNEIFALHRSEPNQECLVGRNICRVLAEVYAELQEGMAKQLAHSTIEGVVSKLTDRMAT
jgi:Rrf2 family protein